MTKNEAVEKLQQTTKENPVVNAVFHVIALRERQRYNLTPDGLYYRMRREGFNYSKNQYLIVFKLLDELGLARAVINKEGRIEQLKDFRLPLPQLGALACGQNVELEKMGKLLQSGGKTSIEAATPSQRVVPSGSNVVVTQQLVSKRTPVRRFVVTKAGPPATEPVQVPTREARAPRPYQTPNSRLILTVLINDKPINIPVPRNLTPDELAKFMGELMEMDGHRE